MGKLYRTSEADGHFHFAYVSQQGVGKTDAIEGHTHPIQIIETQTQSMDEATGQPIIDVVQDLAIGEADGHTHQLIPFIYEQQTKTIKQTTELIEELHERFFNAREIERKSRDKAIESKAFVIGDQWTAEDRARLQKEQRTCLTVNEVKPKCDILSGTQRQSRTDIHYIPVEGGDARVADLLNIVAGNIQDINNYPAEETSVFEDQVQLGRGNFCVYIDRTFNLEGDIKVEKDEWDEVWYSEHNKLDGSDAEYCIRAKWMTKDLGVRMFGQKFEKVPEGFQDADVRQAVSVDIPGLDYVATNRTPLDIDLIDKKAKKYRVFEQQVKEYRKMPVVFNLYDSFTQNLSGISNEDLARIESIQTLNKTDVTQVQVVVYIYASNVLLAAYDSPLGEYLGRVPVYANKYKEYFYGKVEEMKDFQREINWRHSQAVDIIRRASHYSEYYDGQTFEDDNQEYEYIKNANKAGALIKVQDTNRLPVKREGIKFPTEIVNLENMSSAKMKEISNVNMEMMGLSSGANQSGIAIMENKKQGLTGNEYLFDNLANSKRQLGKILLKAIQVTYTPERIYRIVENRKTREDISVGLRTDVLSYTPEEIIALLNTSDLSKYDISVTESLHSPTKRQYNFIIWSEMARNGYPIPPEMLVQMSDLPDKDKVLTMIQQQQQMQMQLEQQKMQTELQKTAMAKGGSEPPQPGGVPGQ